MHTLLWVLHHTKSNFNTQSWNSFFSDAKKKSHWYCISSFWLLSLSLMICLCWSVSSSVYLSLRLIWQQQTDDNSEFLNEPEKINMKQRLLSSCVNYAVLSWQLRTMQLSEIVLKNVNFWRWSSQRRHHRLNYLSSLMKSFSLSSGRVEQRSHCSERMFKRSALTYR